MARSISGRVHSTGANHLFGQRPQQAAILESNREIELLSIVPNTGRPLSKSSCQYPKSRANGDQAAR